MERKCKLLELNASAIQNKLKDEQEAHLLAAENAERNRKMVESLCMRLSCCQEELGSEFDRCDSLEREKIDLLNNFESQKVNFSLKCFKFFQIFVNFQLENEQDLFRLNRTREQQTKLIDFLQAKVEELEPNKKKKVSSPDLEHHLTLLLEEEGYRLPTSNAISRTSRSFRSRKVFQHPITSKSEYSTKRAANRELKWWKRELRNLPILNFESFSETFEASKSEIKCCY